MKHKAQVQWQGDLKSGQGSISTESGALKAVPYSFSTRFESQPGTNPEELIAAAHAACFSMALSNELASSGAKPEDIRTEAIVNLEKIPTGWEVNRIHLDVRAKVPQIDQALLSACASRAKENCPISKLLKTTITMEARLDGNLS
jgi:osmotically inducible protein OsmC